MKALGRHLLLELKDCNMEGLDNLDFVRDCLREAVACCGATIVGECFHHFSPQGVSGIINIEESHISIHTWPEYRYAAADVFTCGTRVNPEEAARAIVEKLEAKTHSFMELQRGVLDDSSPGCVVQ